jgi:hypothetical protein
MGKSDLDKLHDKAYGKLSIAQKRSLPWYRDEPMDAITLAHKVFYIVFTFSGFVKDCVVTRGEGPFNKNSILIPHDSVDAVQASEFPLPPEYNKYDPAALRAYKKCFNRWCRLGYSISNGRDGIMLQYSAEMYEKYKNYKEEDYKKRVRGYYSMTEEEQSKFNEERKKSKPSAPIRVAGFASAAEALLSGLP